MISIFGDGLINPYRGLRTSEFTDRELNLNCGTFRFGCGPGFPISPWRGPPGQLLCSGSCVHGSNGEGSGPEANDPHRNGPAMGQVSCGGDRKECLRHGKRSWSFRGAVGSTRDRAPECLAVGWSGPEEIDP